MIASVRRGHKTRIAIARINRRRAPGLGGDKVRIRAKNQRAAHAPCRAEVGKRQSRRLFGVRVFHRADPQPDRRRTGGPPVGPAGVRQRQISPGALERADQCGDRIAR